MTDVKIREAPEVMGRILRATFRAMAERVEGLFDDMDLALSQWLTLRLIGSGTIQCVGDVSRELDLSTGAATRLADSLESRGLLLRKRGGDDRRIVSLELTDEGDQIIEALQPRLRSFWVEHLVDFEPSEVDLLCALLNRLHDRLTRIPVGLENEINAFAGQ